jgi:hypothetical protein
MSRFKWVCPKCGEITHSSEQLVATIEKACKCIAPLWPLSDIPPFVIAMREEIAALQVENATQKNIIVSREAENLAFSQEINLLAKEKAALEKVAAAAAEMVTRKYMFVRDIHEPTTKALREAGYLKEVGNE